MRIKGRTIKRTAFVWIAAVLLFSCNKQPNKEPMKIEWDRMRHLSNGRREKRAEPRVFIALHDPTHRLLSLQHGMPRVRYEDWGVEHHRPNAQCGTSRDHAGMERIHILRGTRRTETGSAVAGNVERRDNRSIVSNRRETEEIE